MSKLDEDYKFAMKKARDYLEKAYQLKPDCAKDVLVPHEDPLHPGERFFAALKHETLSGVLPVRDKTTGVVGGGLTMESLEKAARSWRLDDDIEDWDDSWASSGC